MTPTSTSGRQARDRKERSDSPESWASPKALRRVLDRFLQATRATAAVARTLRPEQPPTLRMERTARLRDRRGRGEEQRALRKLTDRTSGPKHRLSPAESPHVRARWLGSALIEQLPCRDSTAPEDTHKALRTIQFCASCAAYPRQASCGHRPAPCGSARSRTARVQSSTPSSPRKPATLACSALSK